MSSYERIHDAHKGQLCENVTSSTKPEIYKVSQHRDSHGHMQHAQIISYVRCALRLISLIGSEIKCKTFLLPKMQNLVR